MSIKSTFNSSATPLQNGRMFIGRWDSVLEYSTCVITVNCDENTELRIFQSSDKINSIGDTFFPVGGTPFTQIINLTSPFFYLTLQNISGTNATQLSLETIYRTVSVTKNVNIFSSEGDLITSTDGKLDVNVSSVPTTRLNLLAFSSSIPAGAVSSSLNASLNNTTNISVYGLTAGTGVTLTVQFSADNTNWYSTQYSVTLTNENFGFTIPSAASYLRLKRTDAGANALVEAVIEVC
jgi:hypothetical protein